MENMTTTDSAKLDVELGYRYSETANSRWDQEPIEGVMYLWIHYHEVNKSALNETLHSTFRRAFDRFVEDWIADPSTDFRPYIRLPESVK